MTEPPELIELEASGETVGEAKWQALRELQQRHPGINRDRVTFEVLSEGERGLLGVGTSPARILARAELPLPGVGQEGALAASESGTPLEILIRDVVTRMSTAIGAGASVSVVEGDDAVVADVAGPDVALLIGRNGRTIDAAQVVVSAIAHHAQGPGGKPVEVDAGGYRARRRERLEAAAREASERALSTGGPVSMEPMSSADRKLVHYALQDVPGVSTQSEGEEPNRYVVVVPAAAAQP